ncbi:hypothetical protein HPB50_020989 [Hyalomma asiaticum]|uniref:Uncharacterized protein n=1 Tax=Hyalomma asiaticum TaxID=266040 RepID=A0ACB7T415_HYAAI|nr:hypothetical protein HPB50_020989 [Hyalomma asiaticum]
MQPSAGPSFPLPSDRANVGQSVLTTNQLQVSRSILTFSLTHEIFPDSRGPASTRDNRATGSAGHCPGNSNFAGDSNARPAIYPLRCRFCESKWMSKTALLRHVQEHNRDIRRENELLLEELLSGMEALRPGVSLASSTTPHGQDRMADATTERAQVRQRPVAGPSFHRPGQVVQQTEVTSSSDNVLVPASRSSPPSLVLMDDYAQRAEQTRQVQILINQSQDVALQLSSAQAHPQNLASTGTQSCSTAPRKDFRLQVENTSVRTCISEPSLPENSLAAPLKPTQGADRRCTSGEMTTHDNVTSQLLATQCNESRQHEPASTVAVARTGQQSSEGGLLAVTISTNHDPEDRRSAADENTTSDEGLVQHREPQVQQDSTQEAPPCLSFSLNLVQDSDAFEQQVTRQGDDTVQVSCGLKAVKEEIPEVSACENVEKPPSAPRAETPMPDGDLVIDESSGHLSDVRARGAKRDRELSCDPVASEAATVQRSAGAAEDASTPDTPQKKRVKTSWQPLYYGPKDKSGPSTAKASRGTERQESEQEPPIPAGDREAPTSPLGDGTAKTSACPLCSKILSCKSSLYRHLQLVHEGRRLLRCPHCNRAFGLKDSLRYHVRSAHTGERPFECHLCPSAFHMSGSLSRHLQWHANVRSYACHLCPKAFVIKPHLDRHMRSHTKERPFACTECPKRLSSSHALKKHRLTHVDEWPYECEVCGRSTQDSEDEEKTFTRPSADISVARTCPWYCCAGPDRDGGQQCSPWEQASGHSSVTSATRYTRCGPLTSGSSLVTFAPVPSWSRTSWILRVRTRTHEVKFVCRLQSKYDLTKRRLTHVHNLPHECEVCGKKVSRVKHPQKLCSLDTPD